MAVKFIKKSTAVCSSYIILTGEVEDLRKSAHVIYSILLQFIFVSCLSFSVEQNSSRILALLQLPFSERRYILLYTTVLLQEHCSQIYYDCQLNSDGSSWKTTQLRCDANLYFDPDTLSCTQPNNIEDCQDLSTTLHWRTTYVKWSNKKIYSVTIVK